MGFVPADFTNRTALAPTAVRVYLPKQKSSVKLRLSCPSLSKLCSKCLVNKLRTEFGVGHVRNIDGLQPVCKQCRNKISRKSYLIHRKLKGTPGGTKALDLTGLKFGRLTALRRVADDRQKKAQWLCRCDCGKQVTVRRCSLRDGATQSCKCLQLEDFARRLPAMKLVQQANKLPAGEAAFRVLLHAYEVRGKQKGWGLTREQVYNLFKGDCHYCGCAPYRKATARNSTGYFLFNGIDRMNNKLGYFSNNVVSCCRTCNFCKGARSYQDFMNWVVSVAANRGGVSPWIKSVA